MNREPITIKERIITEAVMVTDGFLLIAWDNGSRGLVDLRGFIDHYPAFAFLKDRKRFGAVKIADQGAAIYWIDHDGDTIDVDADTLWLRRKPITKATPARNDVPAFARRRETA